MRYAKILFMGLLVVGASLANAAAGPCDKACMEAIADQYRAAYVKHDPKGLPLARTLRYTENGVVLKFPDGTWDTVTAEVGTAMTFSDPRTGNVGVYTATVQSYDTEGYLAIRLKIADGEITEIEHIVSTKRNLSSPPTPIGPHAQYKPDRNFVKSVDSARRLPREQLVTYADGYFSTLQQNDGTIRGTAFSPEATRIENGLLFPEIEKGFKTGNYRFNERVRDRDYVLIDEERQVVIARGFIDHKGVLDDYVLTDGAPRKSVYREPHSWAFLEMFKVEDRRITAVQAVFLGAPYYMPAPWPTTPIVAQIPPVKVTGGEVSGLYESGLSIFKGIPFAAPPVGALRWKAPAPVAPWTGTRKADSFANACMQAPNTQGNTAPVSEDCLYLNVWTPARTTTAKLPVIVWIHGGGYVGGSTSIPMYDGTALANKGAVVVSVAYRLGVYGFMAHPQLSRESGHGSGAYGIEDLVAGLQWVKANAAAFGGDPDNVTIFGHSAGSAAVSLLAASPRSKGLFHRVIAMSGASFGPLQTSAQNGSGLGIPALAYAESNGKAFLDKLGVKDIAAARRVDAQTLQAATAGTAFRPAADGYLINADLRTLYGKGRFNDTPVLLGNVSDETLVFGGPKSVTPADFEKQMRERYPAQADAILAAYPHATEAEAIKALRHVGNETTFTWNTWAWAREQSLHGKGKVFLYHFNNPVPPAEGSGHGSDVPFAFRTLATRRAPSLQDAALADTISSLYVNFAAKGDPNGPGLPTWSAFTQANPQAMVFDAAPSSRTYPLLQRVKLFDPYFEGRR